MTACELSATGYAFSTVLTAFVGSILNGLFNGFFVAFITGWICWFAPLRIVLAALYEYWQAFKLGRDFESVEKGQYENIEMNATTQDPEQPPPYVATDPLPEHDHRRNMQQQTPSFPTASALAQGNPQSSTKRKWAFSRMTIKREVTVFGWLGWCWSAVYTPISQTIWVATNVKSDGAGGIMMVRAVAIGVSALALTFDTKQRYGASLGRKWGSWAFVVFNLWNATACLLLGIEAGAIAIIGATHLEFLQQFPALYAIYPVFMAVWAFLSFKIIPPTDGSRPGWNIFLDILMGAFAGLFVSAAAFAYLQNAQFNDTVDQQEAEFYGTDSSASRGLDLGAYLSCEGASFWDKFAAVAP